MDVGIFRRNALPRRTAIAGAEHAIQRADHQHVVVAGRHGQGANGLAMHPHQLPPGAAAVIGAEDSAIVVVEQAPCRGINRRRVGGVKDDVVEDVIVPRAEVGEQRPRTSPVLGNEQLSRAGAQDDAIGIAGIVGETADVAALRPDQLPVRSEGTSGEQQTRTQSHPGQESK